MREKIVVLIVATVEIITLKSWMVCHNFRSMMDISSVNTRLQLEDYIHNDTNTSLFVIRLFHNKVVGFAVNILDKYLKFWDIRFTSNVFSLVGVFGIALGFWYLLMAKIKLVYKVPLLCLLVIWPMPDALNLVHLPFLSKLLLFTFPYYLLSCLGIYQFIRRYKLYGILVVGVLILLSLWWLVLLPKEVDYFCVK